MPHVLRFALLLVIFLVPLRAELQSEYRQADTNFYSRAEVFRADPGVCIVSPEQVTNIGGSYLINTREHPPRTIYLEQTQDWLEPITPPNMPASLNCPANAMQVREPQGSVQVALPSAPADFREVTSGMTLPNGSVLRTADGGSVAVLFGGVDSVRLAPNTRAAVQMSVTGALRDVEVDIRSGMVFSKVGQRVGEKEAYAVHTPFGIASAHGTDYVTVVLPHRVDVWVAQGTVELTAPDGTRQVTVSSGTEPLKIMRNPTAPDAASGNLESAESLTALLDFIPMANRKLEALEARAHDGHELTDTERAYLARIRKVTSLVRLATGREPLPPASPAPAMERPVVTAAPPVATKAPSPAAEVWTPAHYPKARPVQLSPGVATTTRAATIPPVKTGAKTVAVPTMAEATPTASGRSAAASHVQAAPKLKAPASSSAVATTVSGPVPAKKAKKVALKTVRKSPVVAANLAPPADSPYPRAKPVDAADMVAAPTVMNTPPPARAPVMPAATADDPNSLGAQLNPFRRTGAGGNLGGVALRPDGTTPQAESDPATGGVTPASAGPSAAAP